MSTRRKRLALGLVLFGGLLGLFGTMSLPLTRHADAGDKAAKQKGDKDTRKADRAGIEAQMKGFLKAFESGDAERVASFWTVDGELIGDDGHVYRGRAAIAKAYRELFGAKEKRQAEIQRDSLRFPSQDTAIDEGHFKVRAGKEEPTTSRYSVLHVREGGKWLMAVVREWPAQTASLRDLEWLIGSWVAKRDDAEVHTTYEWMWNKSFIRAQFTIRHKDRTLSGFQMIGTDVGTGELRSWTFESEGGFGEAAWSRDSKKWLLDSAGRLTDGSTLAATIILMPLDHDSFTWHAVTRVLDGEEVDDLPPVKVTRVKQKK
ncbi:MAG: nuclear transport factor 2 family protein [Gemmataceae bacterium]|nr:nuclear transport factor 2 family protein [Gemmataceae bacterium]